MKIAVKKCSKCKKVKPITEFYKDKRHTDGLQSHCKKCHLEYGEKWVEKNREKSRKIKLNFYHRNKEVINKKQRELRGENPDEDRAYMRKYKKENREKISASDKKYKEKYPEKIKARRIFEYAIRRGIVIVP